MERHCGAPFVRKRALLSFVGAFDPFSLLRSSIHPRIRFRGFLRAVFKIVKIALMRDFEQHREAEHRQAERQPACPLLCSLGLFRYCDLLTSAPNHAPSHALLSRTYVFAARTTELPRQAVPLQSTWASPQSIRVVPRRAFTKAFNRPEISLPSFLSCFVSYRTQYAELTLIEDLLRSQEPDQAI